MLLRQLTYFCAVVDHDGFTRAADALFVSQSAISQQVKALEDELGCALFQRTGRRRALTPAGENLYRKGREILAQIEELKLETYDIATGAPRRLRVGYLDRYEGPEVQIAVAAFARRHPHVDLTATALGHEALYRAVRDARLDILVSDRRRELSDTFENRLLQRVYTYIEVSEGSALAWRERVGVGDLRDETCILVASPDQRENERSYYRDVLNFDCDFAFAETPGAARMMVAGNRGFLPIEAAVDEPRSGAVLRRIPLVDASGAHHYREYYAFWPKARTNALIEEFADILQGLF